VALLTAPAIAEWAMYKDDPEWQAKEDWQKVGAMNFRDGLFRGKPHEGDWVAIRVPAEIGVIFRGFALKALQGSNDGDWPKAAKEEASAIADAYTPSFVPTLVAAGLQGFMYHDTGGTVDLRFARFRSYPFKERQDDELNDAAKAKARYQFIKQEIDTLFGAMPKYLTAQVGYRLSLDKPDSAKFEKKAPSLFQRYRPGAPMVKDPAGEAKRRASRSGRRRRSRD
jgi:hypothetical protein